MNLKTGLHILSRHISLGSWKDILPTLGRKVNTHNLVEVPYAFPETNTGRRKPSEI